MIVVSDSTPLNILVQIQRQHLLAEVYSKVYIPGAVLRELSQPRTPEVVRRWAEALPSWVFVRDPKIVPPVELDALDDGEREAIALALEMRTGTVLADDLQARNAALRMGLEVAGTLGILRDAARVGKLDFAAEVRKLLDVGFRASPDVIRRVAP